ncbi:unnamed protein product [Arabis nemorensis]|uniref:Lipoxygenase domain-containing protein n=1 Tax=Arabis nemorensis TaxID=586526 RepID=A0A565BLF6_9BRAS|nr:unnamed protein product [Arabis nemorensis]
MERIFDVSRYPVLFPSLHQHEWSSRDVGSKTLISRSKERAQSLGTYTIGVYGFKGTVKYQVSVPDEDVQNNHELQAWWKELRGEGHRDKKSELWWPKMQNREEFMETCTIIIWVAFALHATVNFGQYPIAVYLPNWPTICRQFTPKENTQEFEELEKNPDKLFLKTITTQH